MALHWQAKSSGEIAERSWVVPVDDGDSVASYTVSVSGATKDSDERNGDIVTVTFSGGTDGATAIVTLSATTNNGLVLQETAYLPIRVTTEALGNTVRDVCNFALRPIVGLGGTPTADELADAQEHLDDMLAMWAESGANLGVKLPTAANDILYVSDASLQGIKNNLRMRLGEVYSKPVDQVTALSALRGLQQIKAALLPNDREGADFF